MAVYKQPKSKYWWYKFFWNGEPIRESTKQTGDSGEAERYFRDDSERRSGMNPNTIGA